MGNVFCSPSKDKLPPLQPVPHCDNERFMGTWFVVGVMPTILEKTCSNAIEQYTLVSNKKGHDVDIAWSANEKEDPLTSPTLTRLSQKGYIQGDNDVSKKSSATWKISPLWPILMPYIIIELDVNDYSYSVIGFPSREYCWILYRHPVMPNALYQQLVDRLIHEHQYNIASLRRVPQVWTAAERERRGLSEAEIPDTMLLQQQQQGNPDDEDGLALMKEKDISYY